MKDFNYKDTAHFLEIFRNWWDIVNNTSNVKGNRKRNEFCKPILNFDDFRCQFFFKFLTWLNSWKNLETNGHLTLDTFKALHQSTTVLLLLTEYCFKNFDISYLLAGKFTTEKLEKRFGNYRLLSVCVWLQLPCII